jgi:hypothetical protein
MALTPWPVTVVSIQVTVVSGLIGARPKSNKIARPVGRFGRASTALAVF